jgi:uncharacterized SAM-binding protein YcdF (DUF218 family)
MRAAIASFYPSTTDARGSVPAMQRFVLVCLLALIAAYAVGAPVFLQRKDDPLPARADAIVVLAGSDAGITAGQALIGGGIADTLVISANRNDRSERRNHLCRSQEPGVICVYAGPFSAVNEAQAISQVAEQRNWDTLVLVTSRYNLFRAERTFRRCGDFRIVGYGVDEPWWRVAVGVPLEWIRLGVAETVRRGC